MPGLPPLVVKKRPYFTDPALLGFTEEEPWHEPPEKGEAVDPRLASRGGRLDAEDSSARAELGAQRPGRSRSGFPWRIRICGGDGTLLGQPRLCELFAGRRVVEVYVNRDLVVRTDGALGRQETDLTLSEEASGGS